MLPSGLLIGALPVATWHLYGDQTLESGDSPIYTVPDSWVELEHPIGLVSVLAVFAALGWLALEYWLRNWRGAWFVILGLLSGLGISTGFGGRVITAGVYGANIGGVFFILGIPVIYAATIVAVGFVTYKIADSPAGPCPRVFTAEPGKRIVVTATILACCVVPFAAASIFDRSFGSWEDIGTLITALAFSAVVIGIVLFACLAVCVAIWLLLFMPADIVRKRELRW